MRPEGGGMQSRLFDRFDAEAEKNKALETDLRVFLGLSDEQRTACIQSLAELSLAQTKTLTEAVLERVAKQTKCSGLALVQVFGLLDYFLRHMRDEETRADTPRQWSEDLVSLAFVTPPEAVIVEQWLTRVHREVLPEVEPVLRRRLYAAGVFPSLTQFGATVELRAVQDKKYRWGLPVGEYVPRILDIVGVVSVHIGVDRGDDFCFQVGEHELDLIIDSLIATKTDLQALRESVKFGREDR